MANNQKNVQPTVVTTTTSVLNRRGRRRRRRANRTSQSGTTTVRKVTTTRQPVRSRRRRRNRPGNPGQQGSNIFKQKITATLGTVGANQGNEIELEMAALLNPALTKETTGSNQMGPLQMYAANYNLWRVENIIIRLTPLVGSSAVSGTAIRTSLNLAATPGSPSWSALGARKHKDTNPGKPMVMRIPGKALAGPKDGWFLTSTKNDPHMCIGGSVEIHTLGKTMSTYQAKPFEGPLFLCEITAEWWFKNYNPEPGMTNLVKTEIQEQPETIKINSKPGEPINISVPTTSRLARVTGSMDVAADATPSEIIWSIFDTTMDLVTGGLPPPFEWLFRAGWWFVKRIANRNRASGHVAGVPDAGEVVFQVYQSISDAQNDVPCIATGTAKSVNATLTGWHVTQVTPGNTGQPQASLLGARSAPQPTTNPITIISPSLLGQAPLFASLHKATPLNCIAMEGLGQYKKKVHTFSLRALNRPVFLQDGVEIDPTTLQSDPYPIYKKVGAEYQKIGMVYAAAHTQVNRQPLHWTICLWKSTTTGDVVIQGNSGTRNHQFIFVTPKIDANPTRLPRFTQMLSGSNVMDTAQDSYQIEEGQWYLSVFASWAGTHQYDIYGVDFYAGTQTVDIGSNIEIDANLEAYKLGMILSTAQPLELQVPVAPTSLTNREILALREMVSGKYNQALPHPPSPTPSEYDNMPPLEEEEEEQGAAGGYDPLEGSRQQRVRWPECIPTFKSEDTTPLLEESEGEDDEDYESDLDDDDYAELPSLLKNLFTPEAKSLCEDLKRKGLDHDVAAKAARVAFPHPAEKLWQASYHNALVDGLSPPSARDCAWSAISEYL
nr:capsid protein [Porcine astrovirus 4]